LRKAAPGNDYLSLFGFTIALNPIFLMGFVGSAMMAVMVLLAVVHVADVESIFISKQRELEGLTTAFQAIPRDARVLPLIRLKPGGTLISQGKLHHVAYGVIQQGYLVPTIAYLPGLQPLRVVGAGYCPNPFCEIVDPETTDWNQVATHYDYLWVQHYAEALPYIARITEPVFSNEFVNVYRTRQPAVSGVAGHAGHF
jgi:hypothetical protein